MEVTAQMVKELRTRTGAGVMDCKEALRENAGDFEEAARYLREKGLSSAAKKAGRAASEGQVFASLGEDGRTGAIVEVNCETDFVARTEDFQALLEAAARRVKEQGGEGLGRGAPGEGDGGRRPAGREHRHRARGAPRAGRGRGGPGGLLYPTRAGGSASCSP